MYREESTAFTETDRVRDALRVWVDRAVVAVYQNRSLERLLVAHEVAMDTEVDPRPVNTCEQVLPSCAAPLYSAAWMSGPLTYISVPQTFAPSHRAQVFI